MNTSTIVVYENAALDTGAGLPSLSTPKWHVDAFGLTITQPLRMIGAIT